MSRPWLIVAVLWVVAALNYLDRITITTMHDTLMAAIPMTEARFGMLTTAFLWVYAALSPIGGFLADRFDRSRLILASLFIWSVLTWITGHVKTFEQLVLVRALMGASEAAYIPAALALIADYHRGPTRSLATGIHMTGISIGSGIAGLGGKLAEQYGWSTPFNIFGIFGIAYCVVLLLVLRDPPRDPAPPPDLNLDLDPALNLTPPPPPQPPASPQASTTTPASGSRNPQLLPAIIDLFRRPAFLLLLLFWSLLGLVGWGVTSWMPVYMKETFHLDQGAAGISALGYIYGGSLCGKLIGGAWADRWSLTHPRARILVPSIGLFIAAPAVLLTAGTSALLFAAIGLAIYGLTRSFSDTNLMPILCQVADPRYRATGYGVLNMFNMAVAGLTVYIGGVLRDAHISVSVLFQAAAVGLLLCGAILLFVKPSGQTEA